MVIDDRTRLPASDEADCWFSEGWWMIPGAAFGVGVWATILWAGAALAFSG